MEVVGIAVQLIHRWKAQMVCVDTIGIGAGVYDRLAELRKELDDYGLPKIPPLVQLVPVNVAEKAPERSVQNLETGAQPFACGIIYGWRWRAGFAASFAGRFSNRCTRQRWHRRREAAPPAKDGRPEPSSSGCHVRCPTCHKA